MKYEKHDVEPDGWTDWVQPVTSGFKMSCCDCGLVHDFDFRTVNGRVQFRARRLNRSTAMKRRWRRLRAQGEGRA